MNKLVVFTRDFERFERKLQEMNLPNLEFSVPRNDQEMREEVKDATIILGIPWIIKDYINDSKKLKWVQSTFAGIDSLNEDELRKDYVLTNVKDIYGEAMAEYVFAYALYFNKEIAENRSFQEDKHWGQKPISQLEGKSICILGTGSIGSKIGKLAKAFGMNVYGYRNTKESVDFFDKIFTGSEFHSFLSKGDFVVNVLPSTKKTVNIINRDAFEAMKNNAVFMNIGRGTAVDETALINAIEEKKIAKAVIDVFKTEPLPKESPLWDINNIYITPHVSGYIQSDKFFQIFEENYKRFLAGDELIYKVNLKRGY